SAARRRTGGPSRRAGRRSRTGAVAGASRSRRQGLPVGRRTDRLRAGDGRGKRRGETAEGSGAARARRATDQRDRTELLLIRGAVPAARRTRPLSRTVTAHRIRCLNRESGRGYFLSSTSSAKIA